MRSLHSRRVTRELGDDGRRLARSMLHHQLGTPQALAASAWERGGVLDVLDCGLDRADSSVRIKGENALEWEIEGLSPEEAAAYMREAQERVEARCNEFLPNPENGLVQALQEARTAAVPVQTNHTHIKVVPGGSSSPQRVGGTQYNLSSLTPLSTESSATVDGRISSEQGNRSANDGMLAGNDDVSRMPSHPADYAHMKAEEWGEVSRGRVGHHHPPHHPCARHERKESEDDAIRPGRQFWAQLCERVKLRAQDEVVQRLYAGGAASLRYAAAERTQKRGALLRARAKEPKRGVLPVPVPQELPDEVIAAKAALEQQKRRPLTTKSMRIVRAEPSPAQRSDPSAVANGEERIQKERGMEEELKKLQELEPYVAGHEDFGFSGAFGRVSDRIYQQRKVWNAVCDANAPAYDEANAEEVEEDVRRAAELVRTLAAKVEKDPGNGILRDRYFWVLEGQRANRPYFKPADKKELKEGYRRRPWNRLSTGDPRPSTPWRLENSIFAQRAKESDARAFYDNHRVLQRQLGMDWSRVIAKQRFLKLVKTADVGVLAGGESLKAELDELHDAVLSRYGVIRAAFYFYCARGSGIGEVSFSMLANQWGAFCREVGITDQSSAFCCTAALDAMFIATNYEEGDAMTTEEQDENDDNALMRFEWVEILIRAAIAKFIKCKRLTGDASDAIVMLCDEHLSKMPPGGDLDSNDFRQQRLYTEAMDRVYQAHHPLLKSLYKVYKAKTSSKWFQMEHWVSFLDSLQLIGTRTGIGTTQAKLLFVWSQTGKVDELRNRQRVVGWSFVDFLEGLGRLAEALALPTLEELEQLRTVADRYESTAYRNQGKFAYWDYYAKLDERESAAGAARSTRRPSAGVIRGPLNAASRPLAEKADAFLHLAIAGFCEAWNIPAVDETKLTEKLNSMAIFLSGGIEI